jgi:putative endonuclease
MPAQYHDVYILQSVQHPEQHYTGATSDLQARIRKHNEGGCPHTAKFKPWRIETAIRFSNKQKAVNFESYLKSGSGREFARRHL